MGEQPRWRRRGRRKGKRRRVRQFLQPCLLLLLHEGDAHGYRLFTDIERFGLDIDRLDPSLVYRVLRDMEEVGWITSRQDEQSKGPPRRVYMLAPEGEEHLKIWAEDLRRIRDEVDRLLGAYEDRIREE